MNERRELADLTVMSAAGVTATTDKGGIPFGDDQIYVRFFYRAASEIVFLAYSATPAQVLAAVKTKCDALDADAVDRMADLMGQEL